MSNRFGKTESKTMINFVSNNIRRLKKKMKRRSMRRRTILMSNTKFKISPVYYNGYCGFEQEANFTAEERSLRSCEARQGASLSILYNSLP